jgi:hypothetical protein
MCLYRPTHRVNDVCYDKKFLEGIYFTYNLSFLVVERQSCGASPMKRSKDFNLENVLRRCSADAVNYESVLQLKNVPRGVFSDDMSAPKELNVKTDENSTRSLVQRVINSAKAVVSQRFDAKKGKMLETELYLEWLLELEYLVSAVEVRVLIYFGIILSDIIAYLLTGSTQRQDTRYTETSNRSWTCLIYLTIPSRG